MALSKNNYIQGVKYYTDKDFPSNWWDYQWYGLDNFRAKSIQGKHVGQTEEMKKINERFNN